MENKKSFVLYADIIHTVNQLPDDKAGLLFKHLLSYVNDEYPETDDIIVKIAFEPIKQQLKRDLERWSEIRERRSQAGIASAESKKKNKKQDSTKSTSVESVEQTSTKSTVSVNDNVSVNVNKKDKDVKDIIDWSLLKDKFNSITGKKTRVVSSKAKLQIKSRLKEGYSKRDIIEAIINCSKDDYHQETNLKHLTLEFISRSDKLDKYLNANSTKKEATAVFKPSNNHKHG